MTRPVDPERKAEAWRERNEPTPPDVTAADREMVERWMVTQCEHDKWTNDCGPCLSAALATVRAEANVEAIANGQTAADYKLLYLAMRDERDTLQARVTALEAALLGLMEALPPDPRWHAAMVKAMAVMRATK